MTPAVDALLFDLGGVLVDVDLRRTFAAWAAAAGTDANTIAQRWKFGDAHTAYEIGVCKPDRDAFERVAREIGVPLQRIAFFDDFEPNVTGARAAGLEAFHVANTPDVIRALATVGISPEDA